jgi:hypothetical protein
VADAEGLSLTFFDDGDGTGELAVSMSFDGWLGTSSASFAKSELLSFAQQVLAFPIPSDRSIQIAGGYWQKNGNVLEEELVSLRVRPVGPRGQIGVTTHLATPSDDPQPREVTVEVLTTYEALRRFSTHLTALVAGGLTEARLDADVMA